MPLGVAGNGTYDYQNANQLQIFICKKITKQQQSRSDEQKPEKINRERLWYVFQLLFLLWFTVVDRSAARNKQTKQQAADQSHIHANNIQLEMRRRNQSIIKMLTLDKGDQISFNGAVRHGDDKENWMLVTDHTGRAAATPIIITAIYNVVDFLNVTPWLLMYSSSE